METTDIKKEIKQFILEEFAPDWDESELGDDQSLIDSNILDSLGIMGLLSFIEDNFGVKIPFDQIEPANFENLTSIADLVAKIHKS